MIEEVLQRLNVQELLTEFVASFLAFLPALVAAIIIIIVAYVISRAVRAVLRRALKRANFEEVLVGLLVDTVLHYFIVILGLLMALSQLGVNVTAALAGVGVAGIAIGFAAQDSVANVISGILIFWDKPFEVGDWIETEGKYGKVTNITLRTTRIRTPDNSYIVVPNKRIIDEVLENFSKHGEVRIDTVVGIAYKEDMEKARDVLLQAAKDVDGVLDSPQPDVVVDELAGSSVNLKVRVWVKTADQRMAVFFRMTEAAKAALDKAEIEIPFPHLQLFLDTVEDRVWEGARTVVTTESKQ